MSDTHERIDYYTDPSVVPDPFPFFESLREQGPVVPFNYGALAITGYDEAMVVLRDPETFSSCNAVTGPLPGFAEPPEGDDITDYVRAHRDELPMSEFVIAQDPPDHQVHRSLIMRLLTPRRMRENEEYMRQLSDRLLDGLLEQRRIEVLSEYGQSFALLVIADLLGVPEEDRQRFRENLGGLPAPAEEGGKENLDHDPLSFLSDTFTAYIEDRRREPRDDVLTKLATAENPDGTTPPIEVVVNMAEFLFAAGQDTTARLISTAMWILAEDPAIQRSLREDHARIPNFVEEVLRWEGVVKSMHRMATRSTTIGGVEVPAGTTVAILPGAVNRDPRRFEAPATFRPDRANASEQVGFGRGVHACPGAPLARIEARVSLERFLSRTADIRIDEEHHGPPDARSYEFEPTYILRGLKQLHVVLTPAGEVGP